MQILSAEQIREWDAYTIAHEPVASVDLMERAAEACAEWIEKKGWLHFDYSVYCGKGNNGGDGLAIARMLSQRGCKITVHILEFGHKGTDDFQVNLERLHECNVPIVFIQDNGFHPTPKGNIIIDALFGSGLNRPLEGIVADLVDFMNNSGNKIVSIDIPSGLFTDKSSKGNTVVKAAHTLSFQVYKTAFVMAENGQYTGQIEILDIGLHKDYLEQHKGAFFQMTDETFIRSIYKKRTSFSHKGNFGHALLMAGSYGKMGAAVMAAKACLRSGVGLLTVHLPKCGVDIMQTSTHEAMVSIDKDEHCIISIPDDISKYNVIGVGPGIGLENETKSLLPAILQLKKPLVIDADALNIIAENKALLQQLPAQTILTPHPKEFDRLFGESPNDFVRMEKAQHAASKHNCVIVLKGHNTFMAAPGAKGFFNNTGNPGMATGGSGDVLTGIITGLLAQKYSALNAAILGVYLHGLSADMALQFNSFETLLPSDIIKYLYRGFKSIITEKKE
ncbi:NAD(P)H-hydrate dehydratase [Pinibacter soli]|uniref:Bifunctional NAD(P)H-hydrate repair enzyme n=1 Tax=Pinibacter soli TaxID=3044211 RepID=A0ABT6RDH4_9BACT|nr:NAD(P)H-hydrate dehydratase [Pinibacter soli]MDI3320445.1 NAD(P)H-hydrate dehydratase [Pinibacter soli]